MIGQSLVIGLGNPGRKYVGTRHNLGFEVVARVAKTLKATDNPKRPLFRWSQAKLPHEDTERTLTLAWPTTFMNRSGLAVAQILGKLAISPAEMLVVVDDFNLPIGALRFRAEGSDGGHNGLASIIEQLGTLGFPRLRLGVGRPPEGVDPADYVLSRFLPEEMEAVERMVALAAEAVIFGATHRFEEAMSKYNINPALPNEE
ncbi:MAG: aminoacyl-tRNA hydrolase [Candidatus Zixiibacteriota bacterium]